jgi:hypothetical protein
VSYCLTDTLLQVLTVAVHDVKLKDSLRNNNNNNVSCSVSDKNIDANRKEMRPEGSDTLIERTERSGIKDGGEMGRNFTFAWPCCIVTNFFTIKPIRCNNFTNLFCHETLHVSDSSPVHHQEFIYCTLSNDMSYRFVDSFRAGPRWNCSSILVLLESCMIYTIAECTVNKLLMMDRGTVRNMYSFMTK